MQVKFKTKDGFLNSYAFSCGYVEKYEIDTNNRKTMYKEYNCFHVNGFLNGIHFWKSFDTLLGAKKYYKSILKTN